MAFSQWLPRSRRGGGEYNTNNITVPANTDTIRIRLDVLPDDFSTPDLSVTASIEISADNAQTWTHHLSLGWLGGPVPTRPGVEPGWYATVSGIGPYAGQLARVHFSTSGTFRWGLQGEIL